MYLGLCLTPTATFQIVEAENEEEQYKSLLETREDALSAETQTKGELAQDIERLEAEE